MADKVLSIDINIEALEVVFKRLSDLEEKLSKITNTKTENKSMRKLNSELTRTQKLLDKANAGFGRLHGTMKLIAITGSKMFGFLGAMGLLTGGVGTVLGLLKYGKGAIDRENRATRLGVNPADVRALEATSEKYFGTGNKQVMENQAGSLAMSIGDSDKWGNLANLGLNKSELENMPIQEALFSLYDSIQKLSKDGLSQKVITENMSALGIDPNYLKVIEKYGSGKGLSGSNYNTRETYSKAYGEFSQIDNKKFIEYEANMQDISNRIEALFQKLAEKVAPHLKTFLAELEPIIDKVGDNISRWLDDLKTEDIEKATKGIIDAITSMIDFIVTSYKIVKNPKEAVSKGFEGLNYDMKQTMWDKSDDKTRKRLLDSNITRNGKIINKDDRLAKNRAKGMLPRQWELAMEHYGNEAYQLMEDIDADYKPDDHSIDIALGKHVVRNLPKENIPVNKKDKPLWTSDKKNEQVNQTPVTADTKNEEVNQNPFLSITDIGKIFNTSDTTVKGLEVSAKMPINIHIRFDKNGKVVTSTEEVRSILSTNGSGQAQGGIR